MNTYTNNKPSSFRGLWTVFKKEVLDNLRDRRTLITIAASVIITPLILIGFMWFAESSVNKETDPVTAKAFNMPVIGAQYAPNLINWLEQNNINILEAPSDPEAVIKSGEQRVVMVIKDNFADAFNKGKTAPVLLIHDGSKSNLEQLGLRTVKNALNNYSQQVGNMRLQVRGISPEVTRALNVNISDISTPESRNAKLVILVPYIVIMFIMVGGMYLAIDTTAGEREKGSLESLLTLPVSRNNVLLAKLLATAFFSALTFLLVLIGLSLSMKYAPVESITLIIDASKLIHIFISCLPFVFVASSILILLASFTKSYKEAQSYLSFIMMVPTLPLMMLGVISPEASLSNMWAPSLSQALIIIETLKGDTIPMHLTALSMGSSLAIAALLSYAAIKLYQRERILG
jgi:sodium transport system permease protein